jgi:glycine/D-amino acid oxidase-like deaminating enzyme
MAEVGWDEDAAVRAWAGLPTLRTDVTADACVVGLGGSGLAAIAALRERGLSVIGLDAGRVAAGAGGRNGGFLLGGPAAFLHTAIGLWGTDAAVQMYRATLAELDRLCAAAPDLVHRVGSIRLAGLPGGPRNEAEAMGLERELDDLVAHADALRAHGIAVETYDGDLGHGLFLPDDASTNPAARAIRTAAFLGGDLYENSAVVEIKAGGVRTEQGSVSAALIVVAVDGNLEKVLPQLAGRVRTARLQMLATAPIEAVLPCPVYGRWGYDYAQQDGAGHLFAGGGRDRFLDAEWTDSAEPTPDVQAYIETVAERMAGRPVQVTHRWAASVGFTADGRPVCEEVDDGVFAIGGYNGTGNLVGPVAARACVDLALDRARPPAYLAPAASGQ